MITASDVPNASRVASVLSIPPVVYSQNWTGVIRDPPPTPKSPGYGTGDDSREKEAGRLNEGIHGAAPEFLLQSYYVPGLK